MRNSVCITPFGIVLFQEFIEGYWQTHLFKIDSASDPGIREARKNRKTAYQNLFYACKESLVLQLEYGQINVNIVNT